MHPNIRALVQSSGRGTWCGKEYTSFIYTIIYCWENVGSDELVTRIQAVEQCTRCKSPCEPFGVCGQDASTSALCISCFYVQTTIHPAIAWAARWEVENGASMAEENVQTVRVDRSRWVGSGKGELPQVCGGDEAYRYRRLPGEEGARKRRRRETNASTVRFEWLLFIGP